MTFDKKDERIEDFAEFKELFDILKREMQLYVPSKSKLKNLLKRMLEILG